jgi:hypothetical protein
MKRIAFIGLVSAIALSGCVSAGIATQAQSEQAYTIAAVAGNVAILSGKSTPDADKQICLGDTAAYSILTSTRTPVDGASYTAADTAHATLQATCAPYLKSTG